MKPLLIIYYDLGLGGVQRKIVDIVNYLSTKESNLPIILILREHTDFDISKQIKNRHTQIIYFQNSLFNNLGFSFSLFLVYQIYRVNPSLTLALLDIPAFAAVLAKILLFWRKMKVIISEDRFVSEITPKKNLGRLRHHLIRGLYPLANLIIVPTEVVKNDLSDVYHLPTGKIKVIPNWTTLSISKHEVTRDIDLLYLGRLSAEKNVLFLLQAVKRIIYLRRSTKFFIFGEGEQKPSLLSYIKENKLQNNIIIRPATYHPQKYLLRSKIYLFSPIKRAEAMPFILLEAMACGSVVITSDFDGVTEMIADEINGLLYRNVTDLIRKVIRLLQHSDQMIRIARNAKISISKYHSADNIVKYCQTLDIKK